MSETIQIFNNNLERIVYKGVLVITLGQMDELHERPEGTAGRNFRQHREKLVKGEDFFEVPYEEWFSLSRRNSSHQKGGYRGSVVFLTESGYLLVAKAFTDDLSWKVQRQLVRGYFRAREQELSKTISELTERNTQHDKLIAGQDKQIAVMKKLLQNAQDLQNLKKKRPGRLTKTKIQQICSLEGHGYSQKQIAQSMEMSASAVSKVLQVASALGVKDTDFVFNGVKKKNHQG